MNKFEVLLRIIKVFNKKIIVNFVGSDIRWKPLLLQEFDLLGLAKEDKEAFLSDLSQISAEECRREFTRKVRYVRLSEKYADILLSVPDQSQLLLRPYYNFFLPIDTDDARKFLKEKKQGRYLVVHATTNRSAKGTNKLIEIIREIQERHNQLFDFTLIENKTRDEVLDILGQAHVVIYSMIGQGPGMFGLEAMLSKTLLMTGNEEKYLKYPTKKMVVDTNFDNLEENLISYLKLEDKRRSIVNEAYCTVINKNDMKIVTQNLVEQLYNQDKNIIFQHYPNFFRDYATFNTEFDDLSFYKTANQATKMIKNTKWYKKHIIEGERDRLIF